MNVDTEVGVITFTNWSGGVVPSAFFVDTTGADGAGCD